MPSMFPTLASLVEERMRDDPELTHAAIHALNQWLHETWTFDYQGRIFATPVITLPIVERAIEELEWVLGRGARLSSSGRHRSGLPRAPFLRSGGVRSVLAEGRGERRSRRHALLGQRV